MPPDFYPEALGAAGLGLGGDAAGLLVFLPPNIPPPDDLLDPNPPERPPPLLPPLGIIYYF